MIAGFYLMTDMNVGEFRQVIRSKGFRAVGVSAAGTEFYITAITKSGEAVCLLATRSQHGRRFRSPNPALALLYALGARRVEIDLSRWEPDRERIYARRPDVAARMRRAHQAAGLFDSGAP